MDSQYIYQYTTIEALAFILKNKNIKLNSLINVDDPDEIKTLGINDFGKFAYVSCWTTDDKEKIPFWKMYTNNKGVRIKLPKDCLDYNLEGVAKQLMKYGLTFVVKMLFQRNIKYIENIEENIPNVVEVGQNEEDNTILLNNTALLKESYWEFQKELRYIIYTCPEKFWPENMSFKECRYMLENYNKLPNSIYVNLCESAFKSMEILLGPETNEADKIIVNALIEQYNSGRKVSASVFKKQ